MTRSLCVLFAIAFSVTFAGDDAGPSIPTLPPLELTPGLASPATFEVTHGDWTDTARANRAVPIKVYIPAGDGPFPLVVVSHGLGGSREGLAYFGEWLAESGYIVLHVQHIGSDEAVWKEADRPMQALTAATRNLENIVNRPKDVTFAIDEVARRKAAGDPMWAKADLDRIAVAGHSFGAFTALASSGRVMVPPIGPEMDLTDKRIKACIAMSAPVNAAEVSRGVYAKFAVPCLHMTGTEDDSPIGETSGAERRIPFDAISGVDEYLLILQGGDHMIFNGRARKTGANGGEDSGMRARIRERLAQKRGEKHTTDHDARMQELIKLSAKEFLDAYLKGDVEAKGFLQDGGYAKELGADGTWEVKQSSM